ncbi:MAG: hypothetical protein ACTSYE_07615 [Alphaproteobacteria bacterium]
MSGGFGVRLIDAALHFLPGYPSVVSIIPGGKSAVWVQVNSAIANAIGSR